MSASKLLTFAIRGVLRTTSLTHQTSPSGKGMQMSMQIPGIGNLPFITANSVRGLLRRAAADVIYEKVQEKGNKISRDLYLSIARGAYSRTGINAGGATFLEAKAASTHVFAGLFGGGSLMFGSRLSMGRQLMPILELNKALMPQSVQCHALDVEPWKLIVKTIMAPKDEFEKLPQYNVVENLEAAYMEHQATKIEQRNENAGDTKTTKDDLNNFAEIDCIAPNVPLYFDLQGTNVTPAQVGLVLVALQSWINRNALGGGKARGQGAFLPSLELIVDGKTVVQSLFAGDAPFATLAEHPAIYQYQAALGVEIDAASEPELLAMVYPCTTVSAAGKAKPAKPVKGKKTSEAGAEA